jgi:general secretion pathway protein G
MMKLVNATKHRGSRGFTLIELLVAVAIIGLLAAAVVGHYVRAGRKAREALLRENLFLIREQIQNYVQVNGRYPYDLEVLVEEGYILELPLDPITESRDSWIVIPVQLTDQDLTWEYGIEDVQSGADGYGLDGTSYDEW